ncbi:Cuticle-degrading protease [Psilocybe cubensis]|uniref:Cuticle-degrading protease n=1 Tax=Psilocybe cubensis TaxID=181762 RepID=A0ACB8HDG2_PSICU|nr:Cuticle-degrading protease [Psilocybe cubensis]KAH9485833.1 Cuticle-degrading protease [Psilocybe cubensis]
MHFFSATLITLAVLVGPVFSAPNPLRAVETYSGTTSGKYIVKFKAGVSRKQWIKKLGLSKAVDWQSVNGISSHLNTDALNTLRASDDVEYISEDGIMYTQAVQEDATWGLQRISSVGKITNTTRPATAFTYTYDDSAGEGVDIYIVDTDSPGVFVNHTQFGGRATWGLSVENYRSGSVSGIVTGLDWVISQVAASGRPSIVSLSLGGSASTPLDNAIAAVAAGNSNANAANYSPARAPSAVTVGASTILDERASFSNYGPIVDIFAPGLNVLSSWIGGTTATPHVAGLIAYLISKEGNLSPAEMSAKLQTYSVKGALTGLPSTTLNYLAQNAALEA